MNKSLAILILAFSLVLSACTAKSKDNLRELSVKDVSPEHINSEINLHAMPIDNTYKIGDSLILWITNTSQYPITFGNDYGIKLFIQKEDDWAEIPNNVIYPDQKVTVLPTSQDPYSGVPIGVYPDFFNVTTEDHMPITLRVVIVGDVENNSNSILRVAAYVDVVLKP